MALGIETGFHWASPINPENNKQAQQLLESSGRWGAVVILPPSTEGQAQSDFVDACDRIRNVNSNLGNTEGLNQCIARIYFPESLEITKIPDVNSADHFLRSNGFYDSLNHFVGSGGHMVVPFNELNVGGEPQRNMDPRVLGYFGDALNNAYFNGGNRELYTLFPGPSGLMGYDGGYPYSFLGYFQKYDFVDHEGKNPLTFGEAFPGNVDPKIADKTMLWHGGKGVFDRVALHPYASNPDQFSSGGPDNPALEYLSWIGWVDPTTWVYATETGGQCNTPGQSCFGDSKEAGTALANYEQNVSNLNPGSFHAQVQGAYGYILNNSDSGATSNGWHTIDKNYINAYNLRRKQLGF